MLFHGDSKKTEESRYESRYLRQSIVGLGNLDCSVFQWLFVSLRRLPLQLVEQVIQQ